MLDHGDDGADSHSQIFIALDDEYVEENIKLEL